jgi:voltage-gated potassium channel
MQKWRDKIHEVIFEADTKAGFRFDIILLVFIVLSVITVMIDSISGVHDEYGDLLVGAEWFFTILFSIEYVLRLVSVKRPFKYVFSFYGIIDLLSILPTYISIFVPGSQLFLLIRTLRILRIFRILKLMRYVKASRIILLSLRESRYKISVFLGSVMVIVTIMGSIMYLVEGPEHGFNSIPHSIYWAIVTLTTVGYGDIAPQTVGGQFIASVIMLMGYSIIAVPTGLITLEVARNAERKTNTQVCKNCASQDHDDDAIYCKYCGDKLND